MSSRPLRPAALSALLLAGAVGLSGCAAFSDDDAAGSASDGTVTVAAAFYPLQYVAERVAGDRAVVEGLTAPGQEAHDAELSIRQTATLTEADLTLFLDGFQPTIDAAVEQGTGGTVLEVGEVVGLRELAEDGHSEEEAGHSEDDGHDHGDEAHAEEEGHSEEEAGHSEGDGHDHEHGDLDPHFWLDPMRMADLADAVAEELSEVDTEGAEEYAANAAALRTDLEELDADFASGLASCERDLVVVNHDAFGYLTTYGLELEAIAGLSPDSEPTAADLARLEDLIADEGITTVFSETLVSPETAETLASDAGVDADVLDPIEGLTDTTADEDYLSLMRANLDALRAANGC